MSSGVLDPRDREICLFGYETQGGRDSPLWRDPRCFGEPTGQSGKMLDEEFQRWRQSKRNLARDEVVQGHWLKISDSGRALLVTLAADGSLRERDLFAPDQSWAGSWTMAGPVLRLCVGRFEVDVIASREGSVHSGIEIEQGGSSGPNYFKVIHAR
jgi:hypothetical protein